METEAKWKEIIEVLSKAAHDRKGGSERKVKTTVLPPFPTSIQDDILMLMMNRII